MQIKIALASLGLGLLATHVQAGFLAAPASPAEKPGWPSVKRADDQQLLIKPSINILSNYSDRDVLLLNYGTTLGQLESSFYNTGLKYTDSAFDKAGFPKNTRAFYEQAAKNTQTQLDGYNSLLGKGVPQPCVWKFPVQDVASFVQTSDVIGFIMSSVYTSGLQYLVDPDLHAAAASILGTKARQSAWISGVIRGGSPISNAFETPMDLDQAWTLALSFIQSCPQSNLPLPVRVFNPLNITTPAASIGTGKKISLNFTPVNTTSTTYWAAFLQGLETTYIPLQGKAPYSVTIPQSLKGFSFLIIANDTQKISNDFVTMAGPVVLDLPSNGHPFLFPTN
ncbi:hypothetical protein EVG20_g4628 [Dentipellis fragilis]|uniref:Uncharacterized protein n=1 Tax=Dentipellis fragilis TaxID=205917 RepID=A0A4Y9YXI4_9AGAM|nr:hypothetical protein EVG20_g4628 [Dentipellis fragilis]